MINAREIDHFKQNKIRHIAQDLGRYVESSRVYEVLLKRGVFKWFGVRRDLIQLRYKLKVWINECEDYKFYFNQRGMTHRVWHERGYQKALIDVKKHIERMCKRSRLSCDPRDHEAEEFLNQVTHGPESPFSARDIQEATPDTAAAINNLN